MWPAQTGSGCTWSRGHGQLTLSVRNSRTAKASEQSWSRPRAEEGSLAEGHHRGQGAARGVTHRVPRVVWVDGYSHVARQCLWPGGSHHDLRAWRQDSSSEVGHQPWAGRPPRQGPAGPIPPLELAMWTRRALNFQCPCLQPQMLGHRSAEHQSFTSLLTVILPEPFTKAPKGAFLPSGPQTKYPQQGKPTRGPQNLPRTQENGRQR